MSKNILGIDIGSSKICSIIAEIADSSSVQIIGMGLCKSQGIKKGTIVNIEQASRAIRSSVEDAKRMAGINGASLNAIISLSGAHTKGYNSNGIANVVNREVNLDVINSALGIAVHNAGIPKDYEIVHVLPFRFQLDDQDYVEDPIGMTGTSLKVEAHIVAAQRASLENLKKSVMLAGIGIENIVLSSYAASIAVLHEDEKELGVACIDMGANTCEFMIHHGNAMRNHEVFKAGSNNISTDVAQAFNIPLQTAEEIKLKYGNLLPSDSDKEQLLTIEKKGSVGNKSEIKEIPLNRFYEIANLRVAEIFHYLAHFVDHSGLKKHISGVILTGGMANMSGIRKYAEIVFSPLSVRLARPDEQGGIYENFNDPSYSVVIGLIWYGAGKFANYEKDSAGNIRSKYDVLNMVEQEQKHYDKVQSNSFRIDLTDLNENRDLKEEQRSSTSINNEEENKTGFFDRFRKWTGNLF